MNFIARAFQRNRGPRASVSVTTVDGRTIASGNNNDRIDIRAGAINRGGYAEATGLNNSTVATAAGNDSVGIHAHARGMSTNAWAMRNSTLDVGPGNDKVDLRAVTRAGAFDPAYGMDNSSFTSGQGRDKLRINAIARGNTTDTIAAYGTLNSQINTGADNDKVHIRASASNRRGYAEAIGLDHSVLETETGDDVVRIHAHARGQNSNVWAMRNSILDVGPGEDSVEIRGNALNSTVRTGAGFDNVRITGLETKQLLVDTGAQDDVLTVDGGTEITYISGAGSDKLRLTRNYFTSLLQAKESQEQVGPIEEPMVQDLNGPVAETGPKAETNQFKPALADNSTSMDQEPKLNSQHLSEESHPQTNPGDPLMFVDFITGENGDSIDCDDILIGHGIGLNRQSIFEDGFLSFAQEGNDSTLYFDSDGFNQQDNDKVALVIFKDVQAADFSQHNLSSRIINKNDFLLSQENQQNQYPQSNPATETFTKSEGFNQAEIKPLITGLETDPILMSSNLQPANDQLNPFTTNPAIPGSETNPMLSNTDLQPSTQLI
ncbi:type I secretion C-terminal target domain-containing protein [Synechococcus sp. BIOS-E4-1]|uniref:type I secretion C-terminal target domain-containing protein n=1 Tax=Synechococcus sp. BIOS-E4-1 TaxID=1400864 RepID=UPI001645A54B|nr:type I secretion C-terminal target domain-containing protein [Synechococcus sp. BIOS-E4-1]